MFLRGKPIRLDESLELSGRWKVNGVEAEVDGTLTYTPEAGLQLVVRLDEAMAGPTLETAYGPFTITGEVIPRDMMGESRVTLFRCLQRSWQAAGRWATVTFIANSAFLGHRPSNVENPFVSGVDLEFSELLEWGSPAWSYFTHGTTDKGDRYHGAFQPPTSPLAARIDTGTITLHFSEVIQQTCTSVDLRARASIAIALAEPLRLREVMDHIVRPLENLLTLAMGKSNCIETIHLQTVPEADGGVVSDAFLLYQPVQLSHKQRSWNHFGPLFTLESCPTDFQGLIRSWLRFYEQYSTVCDLLFSTLYNPALYVEPRFLALMQAIEGFHRQTATLNQQRISSTEYRAVKKAILGVVPKEHCQLVSAALSHGNDVSLRERISAIVASYGDLVPWFIDLKDRAAFAKRCAAARNNLAHHLTSTGITQQAIHGLSEVVLWLLVIVFLENAGFNRSDIRRMTRSEQH